MKSLLIAACAILALTGTVASAQGRYEHEHGYDQGRNWERGDRVARGDRWERGQRLPFQYRDRSHIVYDYRAYGYREPPVGYAYYRTDAGDVVLAAVASGIIYSIITGTPFNHSFPQPYGYAYPRGYDAYGRPVY